MKNLQKGPLILSGNAHSSLANEISQYIGQTLTKAEVFKFANDNTFVRILENVRERDIFIIQPTSFPVNDNIMELLIMIDAAKRASAGRITAVMPYFSYARTDKKDQPRVPITGRLIADLITTAGADRVMLDNFTPEAIEETVLNLRKISDIEIEVSGGITIDNIKAYAHFADFISLGSLTMSAPPVDFSLHVN